MEETLAVRIGYSGERREVLSGLQQASCNSHLVQIPGAILDGGRLRLAGGGREPSEGAEDLGMAGKDPGTGGRQPKGLGIFFDRVQASLRNKSSV